MWPAPYAERTPDKPAYVMGESGEVVTYRQLDDRSNQLAQLLYDAGLRFGDHVAVFMENNARYLEVCWAPQRSGLLFTAVNSHFTADEALYLIEDSGAQAVITSAALAGVATELAERLPDRVVTRLAVGGPVPGYQSYEDAVAAYPAQPLDEELEGNPMLYSSGTTGRPKGIEYAMERRPIGNPSAFVSGFKLLYGFDEDSVYLSPAPLYHSAPLGYSMALTRFGSTVVVMERFDAEQALALIEKHRVTHAQFVPTMFVRMLKLPEERRRRYDLSSLRVVIHAAAPCPFPIKEQMIEWWGQIITEYYASTEGTGATLIRSDEWLTHKGSVGKAIVGVVHVLDEEGTELPTGEAGVIYFEPGGDLNFSYHNDPEKTAQAKNDRGWATVGDMGYLDDEGYLYLTDRRDFMIVSGGVNIYPQEAENLLVTHPKVLDCAVFGVPNEEMGEEVKAVVQPMDMAGAGPELELELLAFCREHLARYKCPRSVEFAAELPRHPTGKLYKRLLREKYWTGRETRIV